MKKYYSATKEYHRFKRPRLFYKLINFFLRIIIKKEEVIWLTEKPDEPVVFVANHTRTYSPLTMLFNFDRKTRPWVNGHMLYYREGFKLFYNKIGYDVNPKFLRKLLLIMLTPVINLYFRSVEPIPVYHDTRIRTAFNKTTETLISGTDVVIYPEKNIIPPYKFINELEIGFVHLAHHHYIKTEKCVKFYPVYCCKDLHKILVGEPITYDPNINIKEQRVLIVKYLIDKIEKLGGSLPEHKILYNKFYPEELNKFNF